jgi:hypothetical protein
MSLDWDSQRRKALANWYTHEVRVGKFQEKQIFGRVYSNISLWGTTRLKAGLIENNGMKRWNRGIGPYLEPEDVYSGGNGFEFLPAHPPPSDCSSFLPHLRQMSTSRKSVLPSRAVIINCSLIIPFDALTAAVVQSVQRLATASSIEGLEFESKLVQTFSQFHIVRTGYGSR